MAIIKGTLLDDVLATTAGSDTLTGLAGNDVILIAAPGDHPVGETIDGGTGYDRLWFTSANGGDTLVLRAGVKGVEQVEIADEVGNADGTVALNVDASLITAIATGFTLVGNAGANILTGTKGNDLIIGGEGVDTIIGGAGNDRVVMSVVAADIDQIDAGIAPTESDTLVLVGAASGVATIDLSVAANLDQLTFFGAAPEVVVQSDFSNVDAAGMTAFSLLVTASQTKNTLVGGALDDAFVYLVPTHITGDLVSGGGGNDVVRFASTTALQTLMLGAGVNVETAAIADAAGVSTGVTALGLNAAAVKQKIKLDGNDGNNTLTGSAFDDVLNGNGGADVQSGGAGNDVYAVDDGADGVAGDKISDASGTNDRIAFTATAAGTLVLGPNITGVESVWTTDLAFAIAGTTALNVDGSAAKALSYVGNAGANLFTGGIGNDTFAGNAGTDTVNGGAGADTVIMDVASPDQIDAGNATAAEGNTLKLIGTAGAAVEVDLSLGAGVDQLATLAQVQSDFSHVDAAALGGAGVLVTASALSNVLTGSAQADVFVLLAAAHLGSDKIDALGGNDTLRFAPAGLAQTLTLTASVKHIEVFEIADAAGDTSDTVGHKINAAALTDAGVTLRGNDGANALTGTKNNDTMEGNLGADTLTGGLGDDVYLYADAADFEAGEKITDAGGNDTVKFTANTGTLDLSGVTGIESYVFEGTGSVGFDLSALTVAATVTGNAGDNTILGTKGNDTINGGLGNDSIDGGLGNDSLVGETGNDTIVGGSGDDRIDGSEDVDSILGGIGNDTILASVDEMDVINAGTGATENNLLVLSGTGIISIDLGDLVDQTSGAGVQIGITYVDASQMEAGLTPDDLGMIITGRNTAKGDSIIGSPRADEFTAGLGKDTIEGGAGDDVWYVFSAAEIAGDVYSDNGGDSGDYLYFAVANNTTVTVKDSEVNGIDVGAAGFGPGDTNNININVSAMSEHFSLAGNAGNNVLTGTNFGGTFFDWGGADKMNGGMGNDEYVIIEDWVLDAPGQTGDRITDSGGFDDLYNATSSVLIVKSAHIKGVERFVVSGSDLPEGPQPGNYIRDITVLNTGGIDASNLTYAIHLAGSYGDNALTGTSKADTIIGWGGFDTIVGGAGNDDITMHLGTLATDDATPGGDIDQIDAGAGLDRLFLQGKPGGVVVVDLMAADQIVSIDGVAEALSQSGFDRFVDASAIERPAAAPDTANFGVVLKGTAGADTLIGTSEDDVLVGRAGVDVMVGGVGDDVFVLNSASEHAVGELLQGGAGNDAIRFASITAAQTLTVKANLVSEIEEVWISDEDGDTTGTTALNVNASAMATGMKLVGNDGVNLLTGTVAADTLVGNGGTDTLAGGSGNDLYLVEDSAHVVPGERITETATGGTDTLRFISGTDGSAVTLSSFMANLEVVEIWDGPDTLAGALALDLDASLLPDGVTLLGNKFDNVLVGTAFNDSIQGQLGNDTIDAGGGADTIRTSLDADTADDVDGGDITDIGGNLVILSGELTTLMMWDLTAVDQLISVEGVNRAFAGITHLDLSALTGDFGIVITGSAQANTLITGANDDLFITATPFAPGEKITAGAGEDRLFFTSTNNGDVLMLSTLITGLEKVELNGTADLSVNAAAVTTALHITGNAGNNTLTGTSKADTIIGGGGVDTITGGTGTDEIQITADTALSAINAGAATEANKLVMSGTLAGAFVVDLSIVSATGDQITGGGDLATQRGFAHLDASGMTAASVSVTGSAIGNVIIGTAQADSIAGGLGADTIGVHVDGGMDTISGGLVAEGNELVLLGNAVATQTVDLSELLLDQLTSLGGVQSGFMHLDASAMMGAGVAVTGSDAGNRIVGSALADTVAGGAGADTFVWDAATPGDTVDAGDPGDGDTFVAIGIATANLTVNLSVAPGGDQFTSIGGTQSDFQHVDARKLEDFGIDARGNALNNNVTGTVLGDNFTGLAGADTFVLGGGAEGDGVTDVVVYETKSDGANSIAAAFSFDRIQEFDDFDLIRFTSDFNGGAYDLDDIGTANDLFVFASDTKANFSATHEALLVSDVKSKLTTEAQLKSFSSVIAAINKVGVIAAAGDDGLIVVQAPSMAGFYYYQESDGIVNKVSAGELTLLGIVDAKAGLGDFSFV